MSIQAEIVRRLESSLSEERLDPTIRALRVALAALVQRFGMVGITEPHQLLDILRFALPRLLNGLGQRGENPFAELLGVQAATRVLADMRGDTAGSDISQAEADALREAGRSFGF